MELTVDDDLLDLITGARPRTAVPDNMADRAVDLLPRRRRRWLVTVGIAAPAVLLLGAGTATAVTSWESWAWWADTAIEQTFDHEVCRFWFQVEPIGIGYDDPAMVEAQRIVAAIDLDAVMASDEYAAEREAFESEPDLREAMDEGRIPTWAGQQTALGQVMSRQLRAEMAAAGFDPDTVGLMSQLLECVPR